MPTEDEARYAVPSVHVADDEKLLTPAPQEPIPPGGVFPQLNLAGNDFDVASGQAFQRMPEPEKPDAPVPDLMSAPEDVLMMGYEPSNPAPQAPNLAGVDGPPDPNTLMTEPNQGAILPDYGVPDFASLNAPLQPYDLEDGINYAYGSEWSPDPLNPDITSYNKPCGLDIQQQKYPEDLTKPDPYLNDLTGYDQVQGVDFLRNPSDPDPQLPDLQNPQLEPEVHMMERPGDMDDSALSTMPSDPTYDQVKNVGYDISYMVQPGSTRRSRHMDLLMNGLRDGDS